MDNLFQRKQINDTRLINALLQNLFPTTLKGTSSKIFSGKTEDFLTCLNLSLYLKKKTFEYTSAKFFEEAALNAILKSLYTGANIADIMLLIDEMPKIFDMDYPAVKNIREALIEIIPKLIETFRKQNRWQEIKYISNTLELMKKF